MPSASTTASATAGPSKAAVPQNAMYQRAALVSAYNELGKELGSSKLKAVGNYTLGRTIGEGTFGKVRMGTHRLTGTRVAIKQVPKDHSASLTREIHHHRRLNHANVMKLYEVLATETHIWMVSELCLGGELYDYLVERGTLSEPEARRVFGQLCLAIAYVHGRGIVHRDLKLENVLLDEKCNVKLGDFGFTREFEGKRLMETFCGTTGYAAPEMLAGRKYTGEEVDIWSLGIILYALLAGALPFDDDDESVMKAKILSGEYEMPDYLSEEARDLLNGILKLEPTQRLSIKSILSHPWFSKIMVATPMSTVEEDADSQYFPPMDQLKEGMTESASSQDHHKEAVPEEGPSAVLQGLGVELPAAVPAPPIPALSSQGTSENSSSSSDHLSATHTAPTSVEESVNSTEEATTAIEDKPIAMLHRNESQMTIKRNASSGSEGFTPRPTTANNARPGGGLLPTHHEAPMSMSRSSSTTDNPLRLRLGGAEPMLIRKSSQGSSRGHPRTPSRTKRRSVSSSGLSDHHPPHLNNRPIDYVSMLEHSQPDIFSTPLEQNLLHQLSNLGIDVGQTVHSILTDACDASAAMWWLLKRKMEDRQEAEKMFPNITSASTPTMPTSAVAPASVTTTTDRAVAPPLPPKNEARRGSGQTTPSDEKLVAASSSNQESSERQPQRPGEQLPLSSLAAAYALEPTVAGSGSLDSSTPNRKSRGNPFEQVWNPESSSRPTTASTTYSPRQHPMRTSTVPAFGEDERSSVNASPRSPENAKARKDRKRASSFSVKLTNALTGGSSKREPAPDLPTGASAYDDGKETAASSSTTLERIKSPSGGGGLFSRKPSGGLALVSRSKQGESPLVSSSSSPRGTTGTMGSMEDVSGSWNSHTLSKMTSSTTPEIERVKAEGSSSDRIADDGSLSSSSHPRGSNHHHSPSKNSSRSGQSLGSGGSHHSSLPGSQSVDTFTTVSSAQSPDGAEQAVESSSGKKTKAGKSSFLNTVRTWLGTEEKQSRKGRSGTRMQGSSSSSASHHHSHSHHHYPAAGSPTLGSRHAAGPPSRSGSVRGRAPANLYVSGGSIRRGAAGTGAKGSIRSPTAARAYASNVSNNHRKSTSEARSADGGLSSVETQPSSAGLYRPSPLRRPSAGSITPTATLYGDRPSRAPSSSSLYRGPPVSGGLVRRTGSQSSSNSLMLRNHLTQASGAAYRPLNVRRKSSDSGTIVMRQRALNSHHRPHSESGHSRPASFIEGAGAMDFHHDLMTEDGLLNPGGGRGGTQTPSRRASIDSRRGSDSVHGGRASPTVFLAHRNRQTYKPPSANPALLQTPAKRTAGTATPPHHASHSSTSGSRTAAPALEGTSLYPAATSDNTASKLGHWRRSWGPAPPSWSGPIDHAPSRTELAIQARRQQQAQSQQHRNELSKGGRDGDLTYRDVFSNRRRKRDEEDAWEDESDEDDDDGVDIPSRTVPKFSGGLGQLDSGLANRAGTGAGPSARWLDSPVRGSTAVFSGGRTGSSFPSSSAMGRDLSGPGKAGNSFKSSNEAAPSSSFLATSSTRYAGVRNNLFQGSASSSLQYQPPALGRDIHPRMISVTEDEDGVEDGDEKEAAVGQESQLDEGGSNKESGVANLEAPAVKMATPGDDNTSTTSTSSSGPSSSARMRTKAPAPAFQGGIVEEEEEED